MAWNEAGVDGFLAEQPFCEGVDHLMANMFPNRFEDETLSEAERRFYAACAEQLDDHWDVFHSVAWLGKNEKGHRDGEADFVVAHPDWGALVVEVKGGGISFESQSGKWSSRDRY
ncbi:MAG: NERD domain-containing protein, partial [Deltaproteobacteria bacterium]|nr:NERD domain-containing protein [Deltaproteobacteria bacterium]